MYEIRLLIQQDIKLLFTNVLWIFYNTLFPLLLVLIMGQLTSGQYGSHISSYEYYTISFLVFSAFNAATIAANSFMEERIKAGNMRILYAPITHDWLYRSKIIASTLFTFVCHVIVGGVLAIWFHLPIGDHITVLLLALLVVEALSCSIGVLFCLLFHSESIANQILSIFINLCAVFGGIFFSMERFSGLLSAVSNLSPMTWIMRVVVQCIYDGAQSELWLMIGGFVGLIVMLLVICKVIFQEEACLCS